MSEFWSSFFGNIGAFFHGVFITAPIWTTILEIGVGVTAFFAQILFAILGAFL